MAYSNNQMFVNNINGETLYDIKSKIDYKKTSYEDRRECIDNILKKDNFFEVYTEECYKFELNQSDALSEDVDVFKTLESMANYLLNSDEEKEKDRANKPVYIFHKSRDKFQKKMNREKQNVSLMGGKVNVTDIHEIIHVQKKQVGNCRVSKDVKIKPSDLKEDSFCGNVLREYNALLEYVDERLAEKKSEKWRTYSNIKSSVQQDMIDAKTMIKGIWSFDGIDNSPKGFDYDIFDFTDRDTILYMITEVFDREESPEMFDVFLDFVNVVNKADLTIKEKAVMYLYRKGFYMHSIENILELPEKSVTQTHIPNIVKKIAKVGCKYDYVGDNKSKMDKIREGFNS